MPNDSSAASQLESALDGIRVNGAHRWLAGLIMLGVMIDAFEQNAIGLAGPLLTEYWQLTPERLGFLAMVTFVSIAVGRLVGGTLADRFGRRPVLLVTLMTFSVGSLICAVAPNMTVLSVGRVIVGLGVGAELGVSVIMLLEFFSRRARGSAVGALNVAGGGFGNLLAPVLALAVFALFPGPDAWRYLFGALALPMLLVAWYRRRVPETPRYLVAKGRLDEANAVLAGLRSGRLRGPLGAVPDVITSSSNPDSSAFTARPRDVLTGRFAARTAALGAAISVSYAAQWTGLTFIPTILTEQGFAVTKSLQFTMAIQLGGLSGAVVAVLLVRRAARRAMLAGGAVVACLSGLAFGNLADTDAKIVVFGALFSGAIIMLNTTIWVFAAESYPTVVRGTGTSVVLALGSLAGGVAPYVFGFVLAAAGAATMFTILACLFAVVVVVAWFLPESLGRPLEGDGLA